MLEEEAAGDGNKNNPYFYFLKHVFDRSQKMVIPTTTPAHTMGKK